MKKLLIVAKDFFPNNSSGAHRPSLMAKYLGDYGWHSVVATVDWTEANAGDRYDPSLAGGWPHVTVAGVDYAGGGRTSGVHDVVNRLQRVVHPYRHPAGLTRKLKRAVDRVVREQRFEGMWSTFPPGLNHTVAAYASRRYGIPWIADFRDLPEELLDRWRVKWMIALEMVTCHRATALVTVSEQLAHQLRKRYLQDVHFVYNGFDEADFAGEPPAPADRFVIRYFGHLYAHRDPRPLFEALDRLLERETEGATEARIEFYGSQPSMVRGCAEAYRCRDQVCVRDRVAHADMISLMRSATVLLQLSCAEYEGVVAKKLFEYLGAGRPILAMPEDGGPADAILRQSRAGEAVGGVDTITELLAGWLEEYGATGTVRSRAVAEEVKRFSRRRQAKQWADLLDRYCHPRRSGKSGARA